MYKNNTSAVACVAAEAIVDAEKTKWYVFSLVTLLAAFSVGILVNLYVYIYVTFDITFWWRLVITR